MLSSEFGYDSSNISQMRDRKRPGLIQVGAEDPRDTVVRWRRIDLTRVIAERFGAEFHERNVGQLLQKLGVFRTRNAIGLSVDLGPQLAHGYWPSHGLGSNPS